MTESAIDMPKPTLCPDVWEQVMDATGAKQVWELTAEARLKLEKLAKFLMEQMAISSYLVHVVGSITSNQYSSSSDIDVHFLLKSKDGVALQLSRDKADAYTQALRTVFDECFKRQHSSDCMIGTHPIEVYFQGNAYQDLMSVGCYDLIAHKWLVGPELADQTFNPYSAYYKDIMAQAESMLKQARDQLLRTYEAAVVCLKSKLPEDAQQLVAELKASAAMYKTMSSRRKATTAPASAEDALRMRNSKQWKIADATFKLIDKFGYMPIFKSFAEMSMIASSQEIATEVAIATVNIVKKFLGDQKRLAEKEKLMHEDSKLNEGVANAARSLAFAALLAIPGICTAKQVQKGLSQKNPVQAVQAIRDKASPKKSFSGFNYSHATNIVALTLMWEGESQGKKGIDMIASVLINRCNKDETKLPLVCLKSAYSKKAKRHVWQFSCWDEKSIHKIRRTTQTPQNYRIFLPRQVRKGKKASVEMWKYCNEVAVKLCNGQFTPISDATEYYNFNQVSPAWKDDLEGEEKVGDHIFGTLGKHHAPYM